MPPGSVTAVSALAKRVAGDASQPLVTFYDGSTGERVELSVKTFDNWVNKVANFFTGELLMEPGDELWIDLPTHWQSTVTLLGAWTAGLSVRLDPGMTSDVVTSVVGPDARSNPGSVAGQAIACSLRPFGAPFLDQLPAGWLDFGREVPSQPDLLMAPVRVLPEHIALQTGSGPATHRDLVERASRMATELGLSAPGRLITNANPCRSSGLAAGLVAPLVAGASVVLVAKTETSARAEIAGQERVTASFWLPE